MTHRWKLLLAMVWAATLAGGCARGINDVVKVDPGGPPEEVVARVNGEAILRRDLTRVMEEIIAIAAPRIPAEQIRVRMPRVRQEARDQLVREKVIEQKIRSEGIAPTSEQVNEEMGAFNEYLAAFGTTLADYMERNEKTTDTLRAEIRRQLSRSLLWDRLGGSQPPTEEEVRAYYAAHAERFTIPAAVHLQHVLVALPESGTADRDERRELRMKAEMAHQRALAGEDFDRIAREMSDGTQALKGGDLGWVVRQSSLPPGLMEAAFELREGEVSEVIETVLGYHVIRLLERRPQRLMTLEEARPIVESDLRRIAQAERAPALTEQLVAQAAVEILDQ